MCICTAFHFQVLRLGLLFPRAAAAFVGFIFTVMGRCGTVRVAVVL